MPLSRRSLLAALLTAAPAARATEGQWFPLTGDDGRPVANTRLPGELASEIAELPGITWVGSAEPAVTLYEFFDFNCPWCRAAARDLSGLHAASPTLRIGLVHNPILSPRSAQAAKVALALQRRAGSGAAFALYGALLGRSGPIDGPRALEAARDLGHDRAALEAEADSDLVGRALAGQMRLAANLGLSATPSYVVGTTALLGHPGGRTLARVLAAVETCDSVLCGAESPG
ncbi:DsbA family protein [Methylobacterium nodulans]|uniref:DSBA oxidoreductase n=1 Tax=Methylobacterium nodulans (strain LMG 21967 / CNCM I-2342 / ORS 2060) TaxID=460265 RepID=B8IN05_METNO|nr:DsbA family protein [Methylobacterium nodulans]ACL62121.1 DSBA oxidoreductase [Methylobacterium nodulans ORS 2060]